MLSFKKKGIKPQGKFFEKIAYIIKWAEFVVAFVRWAIDALRSFPPIPESVEEAVEVKTDEE